MQRIFVSLIAVIGTAVFLLPTFVAPAKATTGPGCLYVVNVPDWDSLNVRARPSHRSRIVDRLKPRNHGIIHLDGPCQPRWRKWGSRWCPITHYFDDRVTRGWVKARYVRDIDCP